MELKPMETAYRLNREALGWLHRARRERSTGRLEARSTSSLREVFFREGRIVGIRTSVEAERLGELLMRVGRITRQHFEDASIFVRKGIRIGRILAELRILDRAEIDPMLRLQAMEVACAILGDSRAEVRFEETGNVFTTLETAMSVPDVILEAARRIGSPRRALEALGWTRAFRPVDASLLVECKGLTPEDAYLLSRFYGGSTIEGALSAAGIDEEKALRSALGLIESGLLEIEDDEQVKKQKAVRDDVHRMFELLKKKDPWRALELPGDVGIETARAAFRDAVRKYHPDRYQGVSDPAFQEELASVCASFTNAFTALTTALKLRGSAARDSAIALSSTAVEKPGPTEPPPPPPQQPKTKTEAPASRDPEVYFKEAKRAMELRDYFRAIQLLRVAIEKRGDHAPYHFFLAEALSKNPRWRHEAEKSYQRAIELDPYRLEYYAGLRKLYEGAGLHRRAETVQHKAEEMGFAARGVA
jgi:tetratricopeptide (TPR) repeat protein